MITRIRTLWRTFVSNVCRAWVGPATGVTPNWPEWHHVLLRPSDFRNGKISGPMSSQTIHQGCTYYLGYVPFADLTIVYLKVREIDPSYPVGRIIFHRNYDSEIDAMEQFHRFMNELPTELTIMLAIDGLKS